MYWGSRYCGECKYNRQCYILNINPYEYDLNRSECIIKNKMFEREYRKENSMEVKEE